MMVDRFGGTCKMCDRPFSVFKWKPGRGEGYRKTEVCQSCARVKNLCQTCILDLQLGLPSQLRDAVLSTTEDAYVEPQSAVNKEYVTQQQLVLLENGEGETLGEIANERLLKIARSVGENRHNPRIKAPQPIGDKKTSDGTKDTSLEIGTYNQPKKRTREAWEDLSQSSTPLPLPPSIPFASTQLDPSLNLNRLPAAMQSFVKKQYGLSDLNTDIATSEAMNKKSSEEKLGKKQKIKYFPKPPSGPPPPEAFRVPGDVEES
jgi:hypothetical protein